MKKPLPDTEPFSWLIQSHFRFYLRKEVSLLTNDVLGPDQPDLPQADSPGPAALPLGGPPEWARSAGCVQNTAALPIG